jgi:hypothetical protein
MGNRKRRRRALIILVIALAALAWGVGMMAVSLRSRPVTYPVQILAPVNPYLCPGDSLRYPVVVVTNGEPTILTVVESWCRAGPAGVCDRGTTAEYKIPVLSARYIDTIANRVMPASPFFRAGDEIEFHHAATDGKATMGYIVRPIVVRDNCEGLDGTN